MSISNSELITAKKEVAHYMRRALDAESIALRLLQIEKAAVRLHKALSSTKIYSDDFLGLDGVGEALVELEGALHQVEQ